MTEKKIYLAADVETLHHIEPVLMRPKMYFGMDATSQELAAFVNGYMVHRSGLMAGGFGWVQADATKTLEKNGQAFRIAMNDWIKNRPPGPWRCCIDSRKESDDRSGNQDTRTPS